MTPKVDFFSGIGIFIVGAIFYFLACQLPVAKVGLGAGGYPKFITVILCTLAIILSIQSYFKMRKNLKDERKTTAKELLSVGALALSFFLYLVSMKYIGFLISTPIFLLLFLYQYGERNWIRMILVSVITPALIYVLFQYVFKVILPNGYFF